MTEKRSPLPWVLAGLAVAGLVLVLTCGLGTFLVRRTVKAGGHTKESEVKANLKGAFVAERSFYAATDRYEESVEAVGFWPEPGNRYRYFFSQRGDARAAWAPGDGGLHTGILADTLKFPDADNADLLARIPLEVLDSVGVDGTCPSCSITIVAAGNLDEDETIDVWSISTRPRTIGGEAISAGVPFRHVNDRDD